VAQKQKQRALVIESQNAEPKLTELPVPKARGDHALVKIHAAALNPVDCHMRKRGREHVKSYPTVLGTEFSGTVVESNSDHLRKGERIAALAKMGEKEFGAFQEYCLVVDDCAIKLPNDCDLNQACSFPLGAFTAGMAMFHFMRISEQARTSGGKMLIWGGSSSVGWYAIQLAKHAGLNVTAVCSQENFDQLRQIGADQLLDHNNPSMVEQDLHNHGPFDYAFDCVGSQSANIAIKHVRKGGHFAYCNEGPSQHSGVTVHQVNMIGVYEDRERRNFMAEFSKRLSNLIRDKHIRPIRTEKVRGGLSGIVDGLDRVERGDVSGQRLFVNMEETR